MCSGGNPYDSQISTVGDACSHFLAMLPELWRANVTITLANDPLNEPLAPGDGRSLQSVATNGETLVLAVQPRVLAIGVCSGGTTTARFNVTVEFGSRYSDIIEAAAAMAHVVAEPRNTLALVHEPDQQQPWHCGGMQYDPTKRYFGHPYKWAQWGLGVYRLAKSHNLP